MNYMFAYTKSFNQALNSWDVSSVTDMESMFDYSKSFNQDLSSWKVEQVNECSDFSENSINIWTNSKPNFTNCNPE